MSKNRKGIAALVAVMVLVFTGQAMAQTKVLGFQLGKSTYDEVKENLPEGVKITDDGKPCEYGGPTIMTEGTGYGIDGLLDVMFSFDKTKTLAEVMMGLEDRRFNDIKKTLASKYQPTGQNEFRKLFKANRDYVYLYSPRDEVKDKPGIYTKLPS